MPHFSENLILNSFIYVGIVLIILLACMLFIYLLLLTPMFPMPNFLSRFLSEDNRLARDKGGIFLIFGLPTILFLPYFAYGNLVVVDLSCNHIYHQKTLNCEYTESLFGKPIEERNLSQISQAKVIRASGDIDSPDEYNLFLIDSDGEKQKFIRLGNKRSRLANKRSNEINDYIKSDTERPLLIHEDIRNFEIVFAILALIIWLCWLTLSFWFLFVYDE